MKVIIAAAFMALLLASSCSKLPLFPKNEQLDSGWTVISDSLVDAIDLFFINESNGIAISYQNSYVTANGGKTWIKRDTGSFHSSLCMGSAAVAFVTGSTNKIRATLDSGRTFKDLLFADTDDVLYECFFTSENTCYAVGEKKFWKTTDAGKSWNSLYNFPEASKNNRSLFFLDESNGWVLSGEQLIKTTDGGRTWTRITTGLNIPFSGGAIQFLNQQQGFFTDYAGIGKTLDGGSSWVNCFNDVGLNNTLIDIHFFNAEEGYICIGNRILKTSNGGQDWKTVVSLSNSRIYEIYFLNPGLGWACTNRGILKFSAP
jgi:photosystem II stability/assembly factor-like uncharacterized protein